MLESEAYRLHVLVLILGQADVGPGGMRLCRYTTGTVVRRSISRHAKVNDTLARQTRNVGDTGDGGAVLADWREGRQGKHASTT